MSEDDKRLMNDVEVGELAEFGERLKQHLMLFLRAERVLALKVDCMALIAGSGCVCGWEVEADQAPGSLDRMAELIDMGVSPVVGGKKQEVH